ncbi:MAG: hypothetical protein WEA99_02790 [Brumimicrobium sp.]
MTFSQYNTVWEDNISNNSDTGYLGIGTRPTASSTTPLPSFNLQIHGVVDYINNGNQSSMNGNPNGDLALRNSVNYGKTSRLGLTNSTTGPGENDGALFMMAEKDLYIVNKEDGDLNISAPSVSLTFSSSTSRLWFGGSPSLNSKYGRMNIETIDNGLYLRLHQSNKYGVTVKTNDDNSIAYQSFSTDENEPNFRVTGRGYVYARKIITTLNPFPDYVFSSDYNLLSLPELRKYIANNNHLPNMPSADEIKEKGADLGEINRLLVEKVEELTLYTLELEERLAELETENSSVNEKTALNERINRLEAMLEQLIEE